MVLQLACVLLTILLINKNAEAACSVPSVTISQRLNRILCPGELIFEDNFDTLNLAKWQREITMAGGGNNEFQIYWSNPNNSFVQNGKLHIAPGKLADVYGAAYLTSGTVDLGTQCTASWNNGCKRTGSPTQPLPPMTSARLHTVNSFSFMYGKVEVRAKMPAGDWLWPAIWMMPWKNTYGVWPASGEIDIMECKGNRDLKAYGGQVGVEQSLATMHWGTSPSTNRFMKTAWYKNRATGDGYDKAYHLYQLEWTPTSLTYKIDNVIVGSVTPPTGGFWALGNFSSLNPPPANPWINGTNLKLTPFDHEFFLILNVAVGGTSGYFPEVAGKPWKNSDTSYQAFNNFWNNRTQWEPTWLKGDSTNMLVDYVKVWAL